MTFYINVYYLAVLEQDPQRALEKTQFGRAAADTNGPRLFSRYGATCAILTASREASPGVTQHPCARGGLGCTAASAGAGQQGSRGLQSGTSAELFFLLVILTLK